MGLLGDIGQTITSVINTNKTIKANKQLAEYQYGKDLEMWNKQNEYNSPSNQMQRFKDAGLNPNLIYGQGNSGNATTLPKYQAPKVEYGYQAPAMNLLNQYQDFKLRNAQVDNLKAQTQNTDARTNSEVVTKALKEIDLSIKGLQKDTYMDKFRADMARITGSTNLMKTQADFAKARTQETMALLNGRSALIQAQIGNAIQNMLYTKARTEKIPYEVALLKAQRGKIPYETMNLISQSEYRNAMIPKIASDISRTNASTSLTEAQKQWLPWQSVSSGTMKAIDMLLNFIPSYSKTKNVGGTIWNKKSKGRW